MAFDFVSYIAQQTQQHYPNLLIENTQSSKSDERLHLICLQLAALISSEHHDPHACYAHIRELDYDWLIQQSYTRIAHDETARQFFQRLTADQYNDANQKIANIILNELLQLDDNAHLGIEGVQELLEGQLPWMQPHVQQWFWDVIQHPEFKIVAVQQDQLVNPEQVMREFNQIIHQQHQLKDPPPMTNPHDLIEPAVVEASCLYKFINPCIALLIIIVLFNCL